MNHLSSFVYLNPFSGLVFLREFVNFFPEFITWLEWGKCLIRKFFERNQEDFSLENVSLHYSKSISTIVEIAHSPILRFKVQTLFEFCFEFRLILSFLSLRFVYPSLRILFGHLIISLQRQKNKLLKTSLAQRKNKHGGWNAKEMDNKLKWNGEAKCLTNNLIILTMYFSFICGFGQIFATFWITL